MPSAVAAQNIVVVPCRGDTCGNMLETMTRISPLNPNKAMARIAPPRNGTISIEVKIPEQGSTEAQHADVWLHA